MISQYRHLEPLPLSPRALPSQNAELFNNTQTLLEQHDSNSSQRIQTDDHAMHSQNRPVEPLPFSTPSPLKPTPEPNSNSSLSVDKTALIQFYRHKQADGHKMHCQYCPVKPLPPHPPPHTLTHP